LKILPFKVEHLEDAAALVSERYKDLRTQELLLPDRYQEDSNLLPLLENIYRNGDPGVVAIQDGRMVGFLSGWLMPGFRGKRSVYSPEWANAAVLVDSGYIYEEMYRHIAVDWVSGKYVAHYISVFANDLEAIRTWHWLGFGMTGIDAVRGLDPIRGNGINIDIQRARMEDMDGVLELHDGLGQYIKGSPAFFIAEKFDKEFFESWLDDPTRAIWLANVDQVPVGFIRIGPANDDVSTIIFDDATTSIYGAFTREGMRGKEIGTRLLSHVIEVARDAGYHRCAVDFEPMNLLGSRFWFRHGFKPVCLSLLRYVDERVVGS
jgi:GNAT superfamily N-acetyltransferase